MSKQIIPAIHELTIIHSIPTLDLNYLLVQIYLSKKHEVDEEGKEYIPFTIGNRNFRLKSSLTGFKIPGTEKRANKYHLKYGDKHSPQHITMTFKPMFGEGTKTTFSKRKENNIKKTGTDIIIQSSNCDHSEQMNILFDFLKQINGSRFYDMIDLKISQIQQDELYVRYHERKEPQVEGVFNIIKEMSPSNLDETFKRRYGVIYEHILYPDNYDCLGLKFPYNVAIKTYRFDDFMNRRKDDPLHHPKLGVHISKSDTYPRMSEYNQVQAQLKDLLLNLINAAGLKDEDFLEDLFFKKQFQETNINIQEWPPKEWKEAFKNGREIIKPIPELILEKQTGAMDILIRAACLSKTGGISKKELQDQTKTPDRTFFRYLKVLKTHNLIETMVSGGTHIRFKSGKAWATIQGALKTLIGYGLFPDYTLFHGQVCFIKYETDSERLERTGGTMEPIGDTMEPEDHYIILEGTPNNKKTIGEILKDAKNLGLKMIGGSEVLHRPEASKGNHEFWNLQRRGKHHRRAEDTPFEMF